MIMAANVQRMETDPAMWSAWGCNATTLAGIILGSGIHFATQLDE